MKTVFVLVYLLALTVSPRIVRADITLGEALDAPGLEWSTAGYAPWFPETTTTHDGVDATQTNDSSSLIAANVQGPIGVSFWWWTFSQDFGNRLNFYVDDVWQYQISGQVVDWTQQAVWLSAGTHTLRWTYDREWFSFGGSGWLDEVTTAPGPVVTYFAINAGATTATSPLVILNNACTGDPVQYMASEWSDFSGAAWLPYFSAPSFTLSAGGGAKTVYFKARNALGFESAAVSDSIVPESPPVVLSFAINDGAATATSRIVTLDNACAGAPGAFPVEYMASEGSDFSDATWQPYSSAPEFMLSPGDGWRSAYFKVRNAAGFQSLTRSDSIWLKDVALSQALGEALDAPSLEWSTTGNAAWFPQTTTTHDGVDAAQSGAIGDSQSSNLIATSVQGPIGVRFWWKVSSEANHDFLSCYVDDVLQFRISGAVNWTQQFVTLPSGAHILRWTYSKDVTVSSGSDAGWVDQVTTGTVPVVTLFAINGGAATATSPVVTLNNACTGDPIQYVASESSIFSGATWQPYSSAPSFTLSVSGGAKTVYFKVRNAAGFESLVANDTILLQRPVVTSLAINDGATTATSRVVTLNNACMGDPIQYMASESSIFSGATWQSYSSAPSFTLSVSGGAKTVYFKVRNAAEFESARVSDSIMAESPVVSSFLINDGATTATNRVVALNNACTGDPVEYMASESSSFSGAGWMLYSIAPIFPLSTGDGLKTVYLKVRNTGGFESLTRSDTISLNDMSPPVTQTRVMQQYGLGTLCCAAYSADGRYIVTGGARGAVLWNAETGAVVRILHVSGHEVCSIAISPDGTRVLTGSHDNTAKLWNVFTGAEIRTFSGHTGRVNSVAFSPDGTKVLTGSSDGTAKLWDAATGAVIRGFFYFPDPFLVLFPSVNSVAFSLDGTKVLTGGFNYGAYVATLWDASTGAWIRTFFGHTGTVTSVAFSPDGTKVLSASYDQTAKLWDASTGAVIRTFSTQGSFPPVYFTSVAFSPDGTKVLMGKTNQVAILWDVSTEAGGQVFSGHTGSVLSVAFSPDGTKVLTGSADNTAKLWDASTGVVIRTFTGHTGNVYSVAFSPDGTKVLAVKLWDAATGTEIRTFSGGAPLAFSPDGTKVLGGADDTTAKLWDAATGAMIRAFSGHTRGITSVAFSPDGTKVLTGSADNTAKLWDASTGAVIRTFTGHTSYVYSVAFSPDGTKVLTGSSDWTAKLWDAASGAEIRSFGDAGEAVFSPDGTKVLTLGLYHTAKLWDAATGALIRTFYGHTGGVYSVAFSPDGTKVLTGSGDGTAKLWDASTGAEIQTFTGHTSDVYSVAFSPDGTKVLTGSGDGTALLWEINPPRVIIVAGGGNYVGNGIADQTNDLGAYTYQTLKRRGYEAGDILYLTAFPTAPGQSVPPGQSAPFRDADGDGLNDVDGWATVENLREALTGPFAQGTGRLLILMIDHGHRTRDFMTFRMNETQVAASTTLDGWLDDLQTPTADTSGTLQWIAPDVTLVVDSCYSGQIVDDCRLTTTELAGGAGWHGSAGHNSASLAGKKRIVIASTSRDKEAVFLPPPDMTSFMYSFLSSAYMGNSMGEAWRAGKRFFQEFPVSDQVPQLDDGTTLTLKANKQFFGASWIYGVQSTQDVNDFFPAFESWTTHTLVSPGDPVTLRAKMLWRQNPRELVAVIRPPAPEVVSGEPVTNLPHLYLQRQSDATTSPLYRVWEVTTNTVFSAKGDYTVSFSARFEYERVSNPVFGHVIISEGLDPDQTPIRAILAVADTPNAGLASCLEYLGPYAYSVYLDRFKDEDGYSRSDWIDYLINPWWDSDSDAWPSASAVLGAINDLPADTGRLYVHLIGESASPGTITLGGGEALSAAALDVVLDALQSRQNCAVVLVVDAPGSGAFLVACAAQGTQQRVILTGGRPQDTALFLAWPMLTSFSQKFLGAAYQGNDLKTSFKSGDSFFNRFLRYFLKLRIQPQMDDNGDGAYNPLTDGALARTLYLGRRYAFAGSEGAGLPFILDVTTTQTALPLELVSYQARLIEGIEPTRVFGQIVKKDDASTAIITTLPEVEFARDAPTSWTWSATFTAPATTGTYTLTVYAAYPDTPSDKLSEPAFTSLHVVKTSLSHLVNHLLGRALLSPMNQSSSDVNLDIRLDIGDVTTIIMNGSAGAGTNRPKRD